MTTTKFITPLIILFCVSFHIEAFAQHCPFDGGMVVVIHLTDEKGEPFTGVTNIKLVQKDKKQGKDFIKKPFLPTKENLINVYGENNFNAYSEYACDEDCNIYGEGMYAAHLRSDEAFYEVGKGDDSVREKRDFEIQITHKNNQIRQIDVAKDSIFTLCYHHSKWSDIVPISLTERRDSIDLSSNQK